MSGFSAFRTKARAAVSGWEPNYIHYETTISSITGRRSADTLLINTQMLIIIRNKIMFGIAHEEGLVFITAAW